MLAGTPSRDSVFACAGEMAERCAAHDWSSTPVGPPADWPRSLRTVVAMVLRSRFPMIVTWGEEFVMIYNDSYIATLGSKHPGALGSRLPDEFAEIWDIIGPQQTAVLHAEGTQFDEDIPFVLERGSGLEETFYTFSWSHVPADEPGAGPGGVLTVLSERTAEVVGARRLRLLNTLRARTADLTDPALAITECLGVLAGAGADLVHGAMYVPDEAGRLVRGHDFGVLPHPLSAPGVTPPVALACWEDQAVATETTGLTTSVALPVRARDQMAGVLLLVPHPLRPLDRDHHEWLALLAAQVTQAVGHATARADELSRIRALSEIDAAKTDFLSNISHEFRTPLTLLLGPLEDALETAEGSLSQPQLRSMHTNATRLLRLVNDLLDVAQMDLDPRDPSFEPVDLTAATHDLLLPFEEASLRAGLVFVTDLEDIGVVATDPAMWEATVINLVANAIKYTPRGIVEVTLSTQDDLLVFEVSDTGVGIPEHEQELVFERFHRVKGPDAISAEGTGLGLALVAESVRAMGGSVALDSEPGRGSRFTVTVALTRADHRPTLRRSPIAAEILAQDLAPPAVVPADVETSGVVHDQDAPTIVVVDDNVAMRERMAHVLGTLGRVVTCQDGLEAIEVLNRIPADLVVTDLMMPRLDGLGLVHHLRADPRHSTLPILVLSARAGSDTATSALDSGADDYVVKPFTTAELLARCRSTLEMSRLRADRAAAAARNSVLAGVSHELQTPLAVIISALDLIVTCVDDETMRTEAARRAASRVIVLDRLVRQFLDWSRMTAGSEIEIRRSDVALGELLDRVVAEHPVAVVRDETKTERAVVTCDLLRTEQILHTLLTNARQAGATRVEVRVISENGPDGVPAFDIEVLDDGRGVDAAMSRGLFTPTSAHATQGTVGIGLAVSRATARAQGGDLRLGSSDQHGSIFVLRLAGRAQHEGARG